MRESRSAGADQVSVFDGEIVGGDLLQVGQFAAARPWFERAVKAAEQGDIHGRVDHASLVGSLHLVGYCLSNQGQFAAARPWFERAVKAKEQGDIHGRVDHASLGGSLHLVGYCLSNQGQFAAARPWFERAVRMDSLSVGIPCSPSSIAVRQHWTQVNTDPRNDLLSRMPSFLPSEGGRDQIGMVAAIKSVAWPRSNRNRWPRCIGIRTGVSDPGTNRSTPIGSAQP
ncbi:MAG: tetratricopeptide repeat protein [Rhodopila sp.]